MAALLILLPFAAFATLMVIAPAAVALFIAAALATLVIGIDLWHGRSLKILQSGAAVLFAGIGGYVVLVDPNLNGGLVRAALDIGLLAVILLSLMARAPFTIQYARETVDAETAARVEFRRANYLLTWLWVAALATMLIADLSTLYFAALPVWTGIAAAFVARNGTMAFTQWYAKRRRTDAERANVAALAQGKPA